MCASGKSSSQSAEKCLIIVQVLPQSKDFSMNIAAGLIRLFDKKKLRKVGSLPECLERNYDMIQEEFCLKIECDGDIGLSTGSLPPGQLRLAGRVLRRLVLVDNFGHRMTLLWIPGITEVTFFRPPVQRGD